MTQSPWIILAAEFTKASRHELRFSSQGLKKTVLSSSVPEGIGSQVEVIWITKHKQ